MELDTETCVDCGTPTKLRDANVPVCLSCVETRNAARVGRPTMETDAPASDTIQD